MQVIYIDSLFFINFIIDYLILLTTAKITSAPVSRWRIALGAVAGALYAALSVFDFCAFLLHPVLKIAAGLLMAVIVFGGRKKLLRSLLVFLAVSAAFGGAVLGLSLLSGSDITGGGVFVPVSIKVLLFAFVISYAILSLVFKRVWKSRGTGGFSDIVITHSGKELRLRALIDTGNSLTDPMTGRPVIVAGFSDALKLFSLGARKILEEVGRNNAVKAMEELQRTGEKTRFCLIPYSAVGVSNGLLLAFKPDRIVINAKEKKGVLVALSPNSVSDGGLYTALIGA